MDEIMKLEWMYEHGLRQTQRHPCPRRLVGKVCLRNHFGVTCECVKFGLGHGLLDHCSGFYSPENPRVLAYIVAHPYNVKNGVPVVQDELAQLNGLCQTLGLEYEIFSPNMSWYSLGHTHVVVIRSK